MTYTTTNPTETALTVAQQAIQCLASWTKAKLVGDCPDVSDAIARARELLPWNCNGELKPLELLFDQVKLSEETGQTQKHYWAPIAIPACHPPVPYPQTEIPDQAQIDRLKQQIKPVLESLTASDWQNLSLLMLILEKYASYISLDGSNVAFFDQVRATSAIAAALAADVNATHLSLVAGDLSGIQNFIYTISSDGALKSLRARSFYLELVTEEIVQQLLEELDLPRTSVIYAGGGNLYLLAPDNINKEIDQVRSNINRWLRRTFQSKVFLGLDYERFAVETSVQPDFSNIWNEATKKLNQQKTAKFRDQLSDLLKERPSYEPCRVCHRDDQRTLRPLNEPDSVPACSTCRRMLRLGSEILKTGKIVRSHHRWLSAKRLRFGIPGNPVFYNFFGESDTLPTLQEKEAVLLVNNWSLSDYAFPEAAPLLLGNYGQRSQKVEEEFEGIQGSMTAAEFANLAEGIKRVGYLRMDVDKLGQIFAKGLKENYSLPKLAGLSRQISYFFKVYLNSLAGDRQANFLSHSNTHHFKALTTTPRNAEDEKHLRRNLLFIYAGGDDLFVSGSWDEVVEFAFDVYQSFRAYTGNHPDITLSGGISIEDVKFPLYQAADESGEAEHAAKGNGRDSLGLFGSAFKWSEWLGTDQRGQESNEIVSHMKAREQATNYWTRQHSSDQPLLLGVLPFVARLRSDFPRSLIRNLLTAAELQELKVKEIKEKRKQEEYQHQLQDIQYYLHLPQIAYTLSRLPNRIKNDANFEPVRTSLKSPYNAPYFRAIATWIELLSRNS